MARLETLSLLKETGKFFVLTLSVGEALAILAAIGPSSDVGRKDWIKRRFGRGKAKKVEGLAEIYSRLETALIK